MKHVAIIIPGLSDGERKLVFATRNWNSKYGIIPIITSMRWRNSEERYEEKIKGIAEQIDKYYENGYKISLIGISAGGSAAINAFCKRKNKINKIVNVCGRLGKGERVYPSLDVAAKRSLAFKQSVLECEENIKYFSDKDREKILTIRPLFDEVVPTTLVSVPRAINTRIVSIGHVISIALAMTVYSGKIVSFLASKYESFGTI